MKNKTTIMLLIVVAAVFFISSFTAAQLIDREKAKKDAVAVREYMQNYIQHSPKSTVPVVNEKRNTAPVNSLSKSNAHERRKSYFMNGNKISSDVYNYGGIAPGYGLIRGVNNFVWKNLSYVFQFGPLVGASVPSAKDGKQLHIISDALNDYTSPLLLEVSPNGDTLWQWQPLPGYSDPDQEQMASNPADDNDGDGKPDSWPRSWYNPALGKYVWPGYLSQDATNADLEVFWAMDDRDNREFPYYPFTSDYSRLGLGIQVDGRAFQWSNALAEDAIFFVYTITNVSDKDLDSVFFGIYGDPDVGGGSPENTDDNGFFIPPYSTDSVNVDNIPYYARSMVYFWDPDMKGPLNLPLGYLGCKFLESPGNAENGIDDDGDGMIDERQDDGIDNDGDWKAALHDVGIDGVPNTNDQGEGDGVPTAGRKLQDGSLDPLFPGEPNFELTDLDEADQIGLTSFNSWTWNTDKISNDESMWNRSRPRNFGNIQQNADIVFIFGSGYISLKKGETKRISMALLLGEDLEDLLVSAQTVQTIYNNNYRFFRPPQVPTVTAVPGDKKVTLYWDTKAEISEDPITGKDFEGYVIYRSTDPNFNDIQVITDGKGSSFLSEPLKDKNGRDAKWDLAKIDEPFTDLNGNGKWDQGEPFEDYNHDGIYTSQIESPWKGYHPVPYQDRGIQYFLGNNSGLVHSFIDSNHVINGQTYYYAVVAYDHGDSIGIPPTETTKKITVDPITSRYKFDLNTVQVIPGPRASGYQPPQYSDLNLMHSSGIGTGDISIKIIDDLAVPEKGNYELIFDSTYSFNGTPVDGLNYSILNLDAVLQKFTVQDTNFTALKFPNISDDDRLVVSDPSTSTVYIEGVDYVINYDRGSIRTTGSGAMLPNKEYSITYRYLPVYDSKNLSFEDGNPSFDGLKVKVNNDPRLEVDSSLTKWSEGNANLRWIIKEGTIGGKKKYPADYEIKFSSSYIDSALIQVPGGAKKFPVKYSVSDITTGVPQRIQTFLNDVVKKDTAWTLAEEIILFKPNTTGNPNELTWGVTFARPEDTTIAPILPTDGDIFIFKTKRSFNTQDRFTFTTDGASFSSESAKSGLDNVYVVPNPYIGVNEIEPTTKLPGQQRGERRIYFENLPPKCTIRIFTLSGEHVQTIEHDVTIQNGREFWNLLNKDGFSVAYGVYFAHVDAPGVGEKIIKFALIK